MGQLSLLVCNTCYYLRGKPPLLLSGGSRSPYEDKLDVTITNIYGNPATYINGAYDGNKVTITTNVPAYITGNGLDVESDSLRTSATTNYYAYDKTITITTPCGQSKTINIKAVIN